MIDVTVAVITAKGEIKMNDIPENTSNNEASIPSVEPTPAKKPRVGAHARHVAPSKGKPAKKACPGKESQQGREVGQVAKEGRQ